VYDQNRRVSVSANPAELTAGWQFAGDDAGNTAWIVSTQQYDWKGRPTTTTHQDGSSRTISYTGCGCAGQDEVTSTDEVGRKRTAKADVFGRVVKSQIFKADGVTPYSTSITEYNVRDQVLSAKQFKGDADATSYCLLGNCEEVDNAYDGYGRLERRWLPVYQNAGVAPPYSANGSAKFMQWQYRNDDRVQVLTDPRGATRIYGYNSRGLVSSLSYGGTGAEATASATFEYNENGQRTLMDDGPGQVTYNYDFLGQMTSETRVFNKTGWMSGSFTISYNEYWAAGHLKKITDPFGAGVRYDYDKTARLTAVTGETAFAGQSNYVYAGYNGGLKYRAWDGLKDGRTYDERMRVKTYGGFGGITYTYNAASDLMQAAQNGAEPYHQTFSYDETGRQTGVRSVFISVYVVAAVSNPSLQVFF
jgi:YD repeat-containing protein